MAPTPHPSDPTSLTCDHCGEPLEATPAGQELRCTCGSLLARVVAGGLELKCRRCKRALVVPGAFDLTRIMPEPGTGVRETPRREASRNEASRNEASRNEAPHNGRRKP